MPPRVERGALGAATGIDTVVDRDLRERIISAVDRAVVVLPDSGKRYKRGEVGDAFTLPAKNVELMVRRAIATDQNRVTWVYAGNEALVHLDKTRVAVVEGFVFVGLTLETDQTGPQELTTVFAVGSHKRSRWPARRGRGPPAWPSRPRGDVRRRGRRDLVARPARRDRDRGGGERS